MARIYTPARGWLKQSVEERKETRGIYSGHFPPPEGGGKKIGTFWSLGKKIDPEQKKKFEKKKISNFISNVFSIINKILKSKT